MSCLVVFTAADKKDYRCSLTVAAGQSICALHQQAEDVKVNIQRDGKPVPMATSAVMWEEVKKMLTQITTQDRVKLPKEVILVMNAVSQEAEAWIIEYLQETYRKLTWDSVDFVTTRIDDASPRVTIKKRAVTDPGVRLEEDADIKYDLTYQKHVFTSLLQS